MPPLVIVCRIAWMDHYRGVSETDLPKGGGAYVKAKGFGHEAFNFAPHRDEYFGFVQATGRGVNLARLGCISGAESLDGVTVIWVATHPYEGGTRIVGWGLQSNLDKKKVLAAYLGGPS